MRTRHKKIVREKMSKTMKALWADPVWRKKRISRIRRSAHDNPEWRDTISRTSKARWKEPRFRKKISKAISTVWARRGYKRRLSARHRRRMKELWANPAFRTKALKVIASATRRNKIGATTREQYRSGLRKPVTACDDIYDRGWLKTKKGGRFFYRSSWEKLFAQFLDKSLAVKSFVYEPFGLSYCYKGKARTYFPDFLVTLKRGKPILVELKPRYKTCDGQSKAKFRSARTYCSTRNFDFVILTEEDICARNFVAFV